MDKIAELEKTCARVLRFNSFEAVGEETSIKAPGIDVAALCSGNDSGISGLDIEESDKYE